MTTAFDVRPFTLQAVWDERIFSYGDLRRVVVELVDTEKDESRRVNVKRFGWLMDYISTDGGYIKTAQDVSDDVIGDTLWGVVDGEGTLQCFGKSPDSKRLTDVTRTGQSNP